MQQLHEVSDDGSGMEEERKKRGEDSMKGKTRRFKGISHADLWIVEKELIEDLRSVNPSDAGKRTSGC
jgi:hypothetical protein